MSFKKKYKTKSKKSIQAVSYFLLKLNNGHKMDNAKLKINKYQENLDYFINKENIFLIDQNYKKQIEVLNSKNESICLLYEPNKNNFCKKHARKYLWKLFPIWCFLVLVFNLLIPFGPLLYTFLFAPFPDESAWQVGKFFIFILVIFASIFITLGMLRLVTLPVIFYLIEKDMQKKIIKLNQVNFNIFFYLIKKEILNSENFSKELKIMFISLPKKEFLKKEFFSKINQEFINDLFYKAITKVKFSDNAESLRSFLEEYYKEKKLPEITESQKQEIDLRTIQDGYLYFKEIIKNINSSINWNNS